MAEWWRKREAAVDSTSAAFRVDFLRSRNKRSVTLYVTAGMKHAGGLPFRPAALFLSVRAGGKSAKYKCAHSKFLYAKYKRARLQHRRRSCRRGVRDSRQLLPATLGAAVSSGKSVDYDFRFEISWLSTLRCKCFFLSATKKERQEE